MACKITVRKCVSFSNSGGVSTGGFVANVATPSSVINFFLLLFILKVKIIGHNLILIAIYLAFKLNSKTWY